MTRSAEEFHNGRGESNPFGTGPHGGDRETDFPNDGGYGSHIEQPSIPCSKCPAKFHFGSGKDHHEKMTHGIDLPNKTEDMLF